MSNHPRKKLFIDAKTQGALLRRVAAYWFLSLLMTGLALICWTLATRPTRSLSLPLEEVWTQFGPTFVISLFVLPIILFDCLRLSNQVAGPMHRMRQIMRGVARKEPVKPIQLRDDDFWREFADEFNAVLGRIKELENRLERNPTDFAKESAEQAFSVEPWRADRQPVQTASVETALQATR